MQGAIKQSDRGPQLRALAARPAGAVNKRELGRTKSDCGTPKLGVGELDSSGTRIRILHVKYCVVYF